MTDIAFLAPALTYARSWSSRAYLYFFNEPNPWAGPWKGKATHILDVAFLFQNYNDFLEPGQRKAAEKFAEDVVLFMNGTEPWKPYGAESGARVYGQSEGDEMEVGYMDVEDEKSGRRSTIFEVARIVGLDAISGAFDSFLAGR